MSLYDIFFLDIDIPDVDGLTVAKYIREQKSPYNDAFVVFFTANPEYAIDAFDCEAIGYLLKPLDIEKVTRVLDKLDRKNRKKNRFCIVKNRGETIKIPIDSIYYIESYHKHVIYHLKDRDVECKNKLSCVYDEVKKYGFYQTHQGFIVNMAKISHFNKNAVILDDKRSVMISVRKRGEVILAYTRYVERESV